MNRWIAFSLGVVTIQSRMRFVSAAPGARYLDPLDRIPTPIYNAKHVIYRAEI